MIYQTYCECTHIDHNDGGPDHIFSAKISDEDKVPAGWSKRHQVFVCRSCIGAGHVKAE